MVMLRQVGNFLITQKTRMQAQTPVHNNIQSICTETLNNLSVIKRFNGIDVNQIRDYVKICCQTYLRQIIKHHGWETEHAATKPVPMKTDTLRVMAPSL